MWTNSELIEMVLSHQKTTALMISKMRPLQSLEISLKPVIDQQRKIDHLIDRIIEDDTAGTDTLLDTVTESADIAEPAERFLRSSESDTTGNSDPMSDETA